MTPQESVKLRKTIMGIIYDHNIDMTPSALLEIAEAIKLYEDDVQWDLDPAPPAFDRWEIKHAGKNN